MNKTKEKRSTQTRRQFIKTLSYTAASALALSACNVKSNSGDNGTEPAAPQAKGPRTGLANPYVTADGRPILVSVSGINFAQMLTAGLQAVGGLGHLLNGSRDVLIKPNLNNYDPYPAISSVTSIAALVEAVKSQTTGAVTVGDVGFEAPGTIYHNLGLDSAVAAAGGSAVHFLDAYDVRHPSWESTKPDFLVYRDIYDAPVIINTCVLKRHYLTRMSCAIKCNVGCITGSNAEGSRHYLHSESPDKMKEIADIAALIQPELNIVDARTILTVSGPSYTSGIPVDADRLIICGDMTATDAYCRQIMAQHDETFDPNAIDPTLARAEELGLGTRDLNNVEIIEIDT